MSGFLETMRASSILRATQATAAVSEAGLREQALAMPDPPPLSLHPDGFDVIAEFKRCSPASGTLRNDRQTMSVEQTVQLYAKGGAAAVSVLTEPERFGGSLADMSAAAAALRPFDVPVMRKDFIVDGAQILEARVHGAGGVLLMLALLDDGQASHLLAMAFELGLFVLLEAFDAGELQRAARIVDPHRGTGSLLVGLNARDLRTLEVDAERLIRLAGHLPTGSAAVAESGIQDAEDAASMAAAGYRLILTGSALMRSDEPDSLVRSMLRAGRRAVHERMPAKVAVP